MPEKHGKPPGFLAGRFVFTPKGTYLSWPSAGPGGGLPSRNPEKASLQAAVNLCKIGFKRGGQRIVVRKFVPVCPDEIGGFLRGLPGPGRHKPLQVRKDMARAGQPDKRLCRDAPLAEQGGGRRLIQVPGS